MSKPDQLLKVAELMDNLKSENIEFRLIAIKSLGIISDTIGAERTRNEMIPFLNDCLDDEDEVLVALAEVLGSMVPQVGGPSQGHLLFPILESLCVVEDLSVRQKAVQSLNQIISQLSPISVETNGIELLHKMSLSEWICERCSSAALYPPIIKVLSNDLIPIVRRSAVRVFKLLAQVLDKNLIRTSILPQVSLLVEDSEDSVRVCLSEPISYVSGALALSSDEAKEKIIPLFRAQAVDRSWRIRFKTVEKICDLTKTLKSEVIKNDVLPNFCLLLKDPEIEVKIMAASRLADFAKSLGSLASETIIKVLLPIVHDLAKDDNATFKEALTTSVLGLAGLLSKADCTTHVLPFLIDFLSEKQEVEVRTAAISNLERIAKGIDVEQVAPRILATVTALSQDRQWRIRTALIHAVPYIAVRLGSAWFDEKLLALSMLWLVDVVYSVREAAILSLRKLAQAFGKPWMRTSLIPRLIILTSERSYIHRETGLYALGAIAGLVGDDGLLGGASGSAGGAPGKDGGKEKEKEKDGILATLIRLSRDPVPNVCFVASRTLRIYAAVVESAAIKKEIRNALEKQLANDDKDVKFFAEQALDGLK